MKKQITINQLKSIIKEEAEKLQRRTILENEKKNLQEELGIMEVSDEDIAVDREARDEFASMADSQFWDDLMDRVMNPIMEMLPFPHEDAKYEMKSAIANIIQLEEAGHHYEVADKGEVPIGEIGMMREEDWEEEEEEEEVGDITLTKSEQACQDIIDYQHFLGNRDNPTSTNEAFTTIYKLAKGGLS